LVKLRELTLNEMLADPLVHLVMDRDGVREAEIRALIRRLTRSFTVAKGKTPADTPHSLPLQA
jgi:hypothetical protein